MDGGVSCSNYELKIVHKVDKDAVVVDYVAWARAIKGVNALEGGRSPESLITALHQAKAYQGLQKED